MKTASARSWGLERNNFRKRSIPGPGGAVSTHVRRHSGGPGVTQWEVLAASGKAFVWEGIRTQSSAYLCGDRGCPEGSSQADAIEAAAVLVSVVDLLAQRGQIRLSDKVNASVFEEGIDPRRIVEGRRGEAKPIRPMPVDKAQESMTGLALAFVDFNRFVTFIEYDKNRGVHKLSVVGAKGFLVLDLLPFPTDYS